MNRPGRAPSGDRLRISAQLIDASTGYSLWADRYDRDAKDVFAIQDEISRAIVSNLRVKLAGPPSALVSVPTENLEAHNLYLQGRFFLNKRTGPDIEHAISLFEQAIRRDSTYAQAYAALSIANTHVPAYSNVPSPIFNARATAAADRALALDSTFVRAHAHRGTASRPPSRSRWRWLTEFSAISIARSTGWSGRTTGGPMLCICGRARNTTRFAAIHDFPP